MKRVLQFIRYLVGYLFVFRSGEWRVVSGEWKKTLFTLYSLLFTLSFASTYPLTITDELGPHHHY